MKFEDTSLGRETSGGVRGAENKIRIVVVGLNFGRWIVLDQHKPRGLAEHFELAGVCDLDAAKACNLAASAGVRVYDCLEEVLGDRSVAAVALFTKPQGRAELIRRAIRAGKHVMTTKPLELDPQAARDVLAEARSLGRTLHLNSPEPLVPSELRCIERWRDEYRLGRPVGARVEVYASYREEADHTWYDDPTQCIVAPLFRLGIYAINDLVRIYGEAASVQVLGSRIFTGRPTPDNAQLSILFKNGTLASVYASFCVDDGQSYASSTTLHFAQGTIYRNVGRLVFGGAEAPTKLHLIARHDGNLLTASSEYLGCSGEYQWEVFARAIRGEAVFTPDEVAVEGLRIIRAMAVADRTEATVHLADGRQALRKSPEAG